MRKIFVPIAVSAITLLAGITAYAKDPGISAGVSYFLGSGSSENGSTATNRNAGYITTINLVGTSSYGAEISIKSLKSSEYKDAAGDKLAGDPEGTNTTWSILGSYTLPFDSKALSVQALTGFNSTTTELAPDTDDSEENSISGIAVGLQATYGLKKINLSGKLVYEPWSRIDTKTDSAKQKGDASGLHYSAAVSYPLSTKLNLEAGYTANSFKYHYDGEDTKMKLKTAGFYGGFRLSF